MTTPTLQANLADCGLNLYKIHTRIDRQVVILGPYSRPSRYTLPPHQLVALLPI